MINLAKYIRLINELIIIKKIIILIINIILRKVIK